MVGQKKSIQITINPDGTITMDVSGAQGSECKDLTEPFETALGTVSKCELKNEYYAENEELDLNKERK
jgi:hypothetical protein